MLMESNFSRQIYLLFNLGITFSIIREVNMTIVMKKKIYRKRGNNKIYKIKDLKYNNAVL